MFRASLAITVAALAAALSSPASADTVSLTPAKDNTLYQPSFGEENSNGLGHALFVGNTNGLSARRALLSFDIAAALPANATITSATLTLNLNKTVGTPGILTLHRTSADWGEGTSDAGDFRDGAGVQATNNDATWVHRFYPGTAWSTPGGDFAATVSSSVEAPTFGPFTFPSTSQLVADVQSFLNAPASNFGWLVLGDESTFGTSARLDSRESLTPSLRPTLTLTFSTLLAGDANQNGTIDRDDFALIDRGFAKHLTGFSNGDFNGDGTIDAADYAIIDNAFASQGGHAPDLLDAHVALFGPSYADLLTVPEPTSLVAACGLALPLLRRRRR